AQAHEGGADGDEQGDGDESRHQRGDVGERGTYPFRMATSIVNELRSVVGGAIGVPALAPASAAPRWATGTSAVLELRVRALDDLRARSAFIRRVDRVARDPLVAAVWVRVDDPLGSWAAWNDLGDALGRV